MNDLVPVEPPAAESEPVEPDRQATPEEVDRRIEQMWEWLCQPMPRHKVVRRAMDTWGRSRRTARWYLQRARRRFVPELSEADAESKRAEAIAQCERQLYDLAGQAARVKKSIADADGTTKPKEWLYAQLTRISSESLKWLKMKAELEGILSTAAPMLVTGAGLNEALEAVREGRAAVLEEMKRPLDVDFQVIDSESDDSGRNGSGR